MRRRMPVKMAHPPSDYLRRRLLETLVVLAGASFFMFLLSHLIPGDPIRALFPQRPPPPELYAELTERYGFDDPFFIQYLKWLRNLMAGDLGRSTRGGQVTTMIADRLPVSLRLLGMTVVAQAVLGTAASVLAAIRGHPVRRSLIRFSSMVLIAIPTIVLAHGFLTLTGVGVTWFPIKIWDAERNIYLLPAIALAAGSIAYLARVTDAELAAAMRTPWVRVAEANGIPHRRVVAVHALRPVFVPIVTLLAAGVAQLVSGLIIVEVVFDVPGVGGMVLDAIRWKDHNLIVGILTLVVLAVILLNLIADMLYPILDPRIRFGNPAR